MYFPKPGPLTVSAAPATCANRTFISKLNVNCVFHHGDTVANHRYALKTWVILPKSQPRVNHLHFLALCATRSAQGGKKGPFQLKTGFQIMPGHGGYFPAHPLHTTLKATKEERPIAHSYKLRQGSIHPSLNPVQRSGWCTHRALAVLVLWVLYLEVKQVLETGHTYLPAFPGVMN